MLFFQENVVIYCVECLAEVHKYANVLFAGCHAAINPIYD